MFIVVKKNLSNHSLEKLGANFYTFIKNNKLDKIILYADSIKFFQNKRNLILNFIRRYLPNLGSIDISPIILILGLMFLRNLVFEMFAPSLF